MDEQQNVSPEEELNEQQTGYVPRPTWQVWLARVCLILFVALIILYYINIMRG